MSDGSLVSVVCTWDTADCSAEEFAAAKMGSASRKIASTRTMNFFFLGKPPPPR